MVVAAHTHSHWVKKLTINQASPGSIQYHRLLMVLCVIYGTIPAMSSKVPICLVTGQVRFYCVPGRPNQWAVNMKLI